MGILTKPLDLAAVLTRDAALLRLARESALLIHPSDIKAAGNEVEKAVRSYFRRVLPQQFYVTSGHLIDSQHKLSPQLDVIIADAFNLPSLYKTRDGTEYVPMTSVYAIGEIKSKYFKSKRYLQQMTKTLTRIAEMHRPLVRNTAFGGEIQSDTTFRDIVLNSRNQLLNPLFSFLFCIDAGDFAFDDITAHLNSTSLAFLPSVTVLMDKGALVRARLNEDGSGAWHRYPTEAPSPEFDWLFAESQASDGGSKEGSNLALLYGMLIEHLQNSHLEPANAYSYTAKLVNMRRSTLQWAKGGPPTLS